MKRLVQIILVALVAFVAPAQAVRRYSCDFESEAARNRWVLNPAANQGILNQIKNKWYLGEPGNNSRSGEYGLYISNDGGAHAQYENSGCWVFAYDTISLDHSSIGDYTIYFDYCAMANVASEFDGVYLFWIPNTVDVRSIPTSSGEIPSRYEDYLIRLQPQANMDYVNGTSTWLQCVATIPNSLCDGTPHYLAFVWTNGSHQVQQPSAMIDNIFITDNTPCEAPTNLVVTQNGTTISMEWTGTAAEYEVSAYSYDGEMWAGPKLVTTTQTNFTGLPIGQTDFIVRAKCDEDFFSIKTIVSKLIYYPDQMCVDYLNLDNAVCYVDNSAPNNTLTFNDFRQVPAVDHGPASISSRHVVHFDRNEREPRTGGVAKTVPDGELASVRLGNWEADDHAERIEFTFNVDTIKYPVLLLKYMPILEAPGHDDHENPRFKLDILINGQTIGDCGQADFNCNDVYQNGQLKPGAAAQGWHLTTSEEAETSADIVWKEWTTVGVNLKQKAYAGNQLTARLTTHDCTFSAHCGYAYFTLGCSDGKLKGMKCGEINPKFEAPDGFNYRWIKAENEKYRRPNGSIPERYIEGRGQEFDAGWHNDTLYVVDCMFVQDSTCYFSLYASTLATNPISKMKKPKIIRSCRDSIYKVTFDASPSWVQEIDHVTGDTLVSKNYHIEHYEWNVEGLPYGWSDEVAPTFDFPITGGDYDVTLRTTCGTCDSVLHYHLYLEPLGPTHETHTYTLCDDVRKGSGFAWKERTDTVYRTYGIVDSVILFNPVTSCDSVIYLELVEPLRIYEDKMLLPDSLPYTHHGRIYPVGTTSMIDTIPSPTNCDTTWVFNLEIYEQLIVNPTTAYLMCEGEGDSLRLVWDITRGRSQAVINTFNNGPADTIYNTEKPKGHYEPSIYVGADLKPNVYSGTLLFVDMKPEFNVKVDYTFMVNYSSDIIAQRWNDVLAIKNNEYNGGYSFDSVQWYVNGMPIDGATDFNYYTEGTTLRFGEEYTALLMRKGENVKIFTCPFIPAAVAAEIADMPKLVPPSAALPVKGHGTAYWYDMLGRQYSSEKYNDSEIRTPGADGFYLLVLQNDEARSIHQVLVR